MATILINDLSENLDLDRQAMQTIIGGARSRGRPSLIGSMLVRNTVLTLTGLPRTLGLIKKISGSF